MSDKAYITPVVLKWARESARFSEESIAIKMSVPIEKLQEWEVGTSQPTIKQAEKLAKTYKRPLAIFFLPEVPKDFQPLQDFRKKTANPLGTASIFIIREIQQKQSWIREVFENSNEAMLPFVGKFSLKDDASKIAKDILKILQISPSQYFTGNPIKEWIDKAEAKGIFISRTSFIHSRLKLDSDEIQGFAIADPFVPFIFINSDDWKAPQLFTLVHELAHIWIAESGISNEIEFTFRKTEKLNSVERHCNEIAANALMPSEIMQHLNISIFNSAAEIYKISKTFGVSSFAFLIRAHDLGLISLDQYNRLKKTAESEFEAFLKKEAANRMNQKKQTGGPNPYLLKLNKNSRLFTQVVLDAFRGGIIEPTLASGLLNTQVNKFSKLEAFLYQ